MLPRFKTLPFQDNLTFIIKRLEREQITENKLDYKFLFLSINIKYV